MYLKVYYNAQEAIAGVNEVVSVLPSTPEGMTVRKNEGWTCVNFPQGSTFDDLLEVRDHLRESGFECDYPVLSVSDKKCSLYTLRYRCWTGTSHTEMMHTKKKTQKTVREESEWISFYYTLAESQEHAYHQLRADVEHVSAIELVSVK